MKTEYISEAKSVLLQEWGEQGSIVIALCEKEEPFGGSVSKFAKVCTGCGGDIGRMFLTGIRKLYPKVWDAIPNRMGKNSMTAFECICSLMILLGVDTSR